MMSGFQAYQYYVAVKNHFNRKKYNFFLYKGKANVTIKAFEKRRDKIFFQKIVDVYPTRERLIGFYVANFVENKNFWIGDYQQDWAKRIYKEWCGVMDSLSHYYQEDILELKQVCGEKGLSFKESFLPRAKKDNPLLVEMVLGGVIRKETYTILDSIFGLSKLYRDKILDPLFEELDFLSQKYVHFLNFDKQKYKSIILSCLHGNSSGNLKKVAHQC